MLCVNSLLEPHSYPMVQSLLSDPLYRLQVGVLKWKDVQYGLRNGIVDHSCTQSFIFFPSSPTIVFPFLAHELCLKEHYLKLSFREYYSCHLGLSHHVFTLLCGHKSCEHFASTSPNSLPMSLIIDKNDISIYEVVVFLCV